MDWACHVVFRLNKLINYTLALGFRLGTISNQIRVMKLINMNEMTRKPWKHVNPDMAL